MTFDDAYISVDVETSSPNPSTYSLLSIGACVAFEPERTFSVERQPVSDASTPEAMAVGGLRELANRLLVDLQNLPPGGAACPDDRFSTPDVDAVPPDLSEL